MSNSSDESTSSSIPFFTRIKLFFRDSFAGIIGASAEILVGHPFDTIKVRMQTDPLFNNVINSVTRTYKYEGIKGFYRGITPTIPGVWIYSGTLFAAYGQFELYFKNKDGTKPSILQVGLTGACTGGVASFVVAPIELIRIRLQSSHTPLTVRSVIKRIYQTAGPMGYFRGFTFSLMREIPCNFFYFSTYAYVTNQFSSSNHVTPFIAGFCAGIANWALIFPIDVLKSRYTASDKNMPQCISELYSEAKQTNGRCLFRGYAPCLLRAGLANAATFFAVETVRKWIYVPDSEDVTIFEKFEKI